MQEVAHRLSGLVGHAEGFGIEPRVLEQSVVHDCGVCMSVLGGAGCVVCRWDIWTLCPDVCGFDGCHGVSPFGWLKNIAFFVGVRPHYIVSHLVDFVKCLSCGLGVNHVVLQYQVFGGEKRGVMFEKGGNVRILNN